MAHHHNIIQVLKTPLGYVKASEELQFTNEINEAQFWRYWSFQFDGREDEMRRLGLTEDIISKSQFAYHKLYETYD